MNSDDSRRKSLVVLVLGI